MAAACFCFIHGLPHIHEHPTTPVPGGITALPQANSYRYGNLKCSKEETSPASFHSAIGHILPQNKSLLSQRRKPFQHAGPKVNFKVKKRKGFHYEIMKKTKKRLHFGIPKENLNSKEVLYRSQVVVSFILYHLPPKVALKIIQLWIKFL